MSFTKRAAYLDDVKGIAIMMVVATHIFSAFGFSNPVWGWFNPFMIGVFFMVSGYQRRLRVGPEDFRTFLSKRIVGIAIPYVFFSITGLFFNILMYSYYQFSLADVVPTMLINIITLNGLGPMWFLPAAFFADIWFYLSVERGGRIGTGVCIFTALLTVYLTKSSWAAIPFISVINKAVAGAGAMALGYLLMPVFDYIDRNYRNRNLPYILIILAGLAGTLIISGRYNLDFNNLDYGSRPVLFYLDSIFGTLFLTGFFRLAESGRLPSVISHVFSCIRYYGRHSMIVMCTHTEWLVINAVNGLWSGFFIVASNPGLRFYLESAVKFTAVMLIEAAIIAILSAVQKKTRKLF